MTMIPLLKEVGRGKRGAKDLSGEDARRAAELILSGESTPAQNGAFLVAERIKMESVDELMAFVDALRERSFKHPIHGSIDCAGPYDGRARSFFATLPTAFVLAACGLPAALHASPSLPPKWGVTLCDVVGELGIPWTKLSREAFIDAAGRSGVLFAPAEQWCPPLAQLRELREELGLRTVFNTAEKLLRYTDAPYMAMGVFHGTVFEKMAELVGRLGVKRAIIVQGAEGSEDLTAEKRTRCYLVEGDRYDLHIIDPELYELQVEPAAEEIDRDASYHARTALSILKLDQASPAEYHMVLLNSAVRLWVAQAVESIEQGLETAREALETGAAMRKFQQWTDALR